MKYSIISTLLFGLFMTSCTMTNPLLSPSENKYGAPAFDKIKTEHYKPAFEQSIASAKEDILKIINNTEEPTFENTIEALEFSGRDFSRVAGIFYNLNESNTSAEMQQIAEEVAPLTTEYSMFVSLNEDLFKRIKVVYEKRESLNLNKEQAKLLEDTFQSFARNGANLETAKKAEFSKIAEDLSIAGLNFNKNLLAATNAFSLNITDEKELEGLPEFVKDMGESEAKSRNMSGWVFTLQGPSYGPFMTYSSNRELRERMWKAYNTRAIKGEFDNTEVIRSIVNLKTKQAQLLGYDTYADYALEDRMAKSQEIVMEFLDELLVKSLPYAKKDVETIQKYAKSLGLKGKLMPWDFSFYSEKYKNEKYALNDELLKPYFKLENVKDAVLGLAGKLYGLKFVKNTELPVYHPEVEAFEVIDESGKFMALLYMDFFPRESKRGGAWMTSFRDECIYNGVEQRPFIQMVMNFTKPTEKAPSLLTFSEVTTLLHEFGHALHGILAEGTYTSLTGTSVARDFVELPSQIMENWAYEPEFLATFAKHYQTGEIIPQELINKITESKNYLAGYASVRQVAFGIMDMSWHILNSDMTGDIMEFEKKATERCAIMPSVKGTAMSPQFGHIFAGGYSAGYYSYKWAEVLEADAFALFQEKGIFNKEVANSFRKNILSRGSIDGEDISFKNFRGRDPEPEALMKKLGLN